MRKLRLIVAISIAMFSIKTTNAQVMITESFKVAIDCNNESCKKQIETTMVRHGAKNADWDNETKTITVTYDPRKITVEDVRKRIDLVVSENGGTASANAQASKSPDK